MTSCARTVFIDSLYMVGYCSIIASKSNTGGVFDKTYSAIVAMTSSLDLPTPDEVLG